MIAIMEKCVLRKSSVRKGVMEENEPIYCRAAYIIELGDGSREHAVRTEVSDNPR